MMNNYGQIQFDNWICYIAPPHRNSKTGDCCLSYRSLKWDTGDGSPVPRYNV